MKVYAVIKISAVIDLDTIEGREHDDIMFEIEGQLRMHGKTVMQILDREGGSDVEKRAVSHVLKNSQ